MTTTAAGCISTAESLLKDTLAACKYFQTWVGASTAAAAEGHIYLGSLPRLQIHGDTFTKEELNRLRPFAIVRIAQDNGVMLTRDSATDAARFACNCYIYLEDTVDAAVQHDYAETDRLFLNRIGQIIKSSDASNPGLEELLNTAGYVHWDSVLLESWWRATEDERVTEGDFLAAAIRVNWTTG